MNQLKAGALLSYLSIFITILIALLYTPIMIRQLGPSEYGLYAMMGSLATYFSVLDLGLGNTIIRYTSRNRAIGNRQVEANLNGMFLLLYSIIGLLTIVVGISVYNLIDDIFSSSLSDIELQKAKIMIIILIVNFSLSFPLAIFGSIMQAYERFVVTKIAAIIRLIASPIITLPFLFLGYGSVSMVLITTIINILVMLFNMFYCFKFLKVKIHFRKLDFSLLKEIIGYSFFVFLGVIVDQIYWNTNQFILGAISGTIPVAIYAIALQFINLYKNFSTSISGLFLPRASIMVANNSSNENITKNMIKFGRVQYIVLAFFLTGFILFGKPFINYWVGEQYNKAYYIVLIVMIPLTLPLIQNFGTAILYAKNLQKFRSVVLIIIALINVGITIPLVQNFEVIGAAIGTTLSLILGNVILMNIYYHKKVGINMMLFWKNIILMTFPIIIALLLGLVLILQISINSLTSMIINILCYSLIYFCIMWTFVLNGYEKKLFISIFNRLTNKK